MARFLIHFLLLSGLLAARDVAATPEENAAATIVIYNTHDPDSKKLADFYCAARKIDPAQEIGLFAPLSEEISRDDYDLTIASPLREELVQRGFWIVTQNAKGNPILSASRVHYGVLIRGMPLKIAACTNYPGDNPMLQPPPFGSCNVASVDSELSVLGLFQKQISGVVNNPYALRGVQNSQSNSVKPSLQVPAPMLLMGRLDGPSDDAVRAMIINGIEAEKHGLWGWGYVDTRSTTDPGFLLGDQWIKSAGEVMRKNGIPVITDDLPSTFSDGFPITDAAAYFGWYAENIDGPFRELSFHFVPGGIAAHLHSFSATTLHDTLKGWTGPLIQHGASASVGNVYEPYLIFTTDFGTMESQLLSGHNLAESYYRAEPVLSWMSILVGDPLYRPYAAWSDSSASSDNPWSDYRMIILAHDGDALKAAHDLVTRAHTTGESLYLEALGTAQEAAGVYPAARASFRDAEQIAKDPKIKFRLLLEQARVFEKQEKPERAATLLTESLSSFNGPSQKSLLLSWIDRMNSTKPTPAQLQNR